jgi:hypothetical protein
LKDLPKVFQHLLRPSEGFERTPSKGSPSCISDLRKVPEFEELRLLAEPSGARSRSSTYGLFHLPQKLAVLEEIPDCGFKILVDNIKIKAYFAGKQQIFG